VGTSATLPGSPDPNRGQGWHSSLPSVRAELLVKLGRYAETGEELERAIAMTGNILLHELLSRKLTQAMFID